MKNEKYYILRVLYDMDEIILRYVFKSFISEIFDGQYECFCLSNLIMVLLVFFSKLNYNQNLINGMKIIDKKL